MTEFRILDGEAVKKNLPMQRCIEAMHDAMINVSAGAVAMPLRLFAPLYDQSGVLAMMPGSASDPEVYGAKVVSVHPGNPQKGMPLVQGFVLLFDHATGAPIALMDGAAITAIRTAAASGLATKLLARQTSHTHAVLGTGVQADTHARAILAARPSIKETLIWGRSTEKAERLAERLAKELGVNVRPAASLEEAASCDVISTVTSAKEPFLRGALIRPGTHINLVGPHAADEREADTETIARSRVYVDTMEGALSEAGDIIIPIKEGAITKSHIIGEIGQVAAGKVSARQSDDEITLYKSLGVVAQDLYAAWATLKQAEKENAGFVAAL